MFNIFRLFTLVVVLICNTSTSHSISRIHQKVGRFYCPSTGKLFVKTQNGKMEAVCRFRGEEFDAMNGKKIIKPEDNKIGIKGAAQDKNIENNADDITIINNYYKKKTPQARKTMPEEAKKEIMQIDPSAMYGLKRKSFMDDWVKSKTNFTGIYVGISYAYAFNNLQEQASVKRVGSEQITDYYDSGFDPTNMLGLLVGMNYQVNDRLVLGFEVEGKIIGGTNSPPANSLTNPYSGIDYMRNLTNISARVGVILIKHTMLYFSVGAALTQFHQTGAETSIGSWTESSSLSLGVYGGIGIEAMLLPNTSIRLEYNISYYAPTYFNYSNTTTPAAGGIESASFSYTLLQHGIRCVLSYRF